MTIQLRVQKKLESGKPINRWPVATFINQVTYFTQNKKPLATTISPSLLRITTSALSGKRVILLFRSGVLSRVILNDSLCSTIESSTIGMVTHSLLWFALNRCSSFIGV